MCKTTSSRNNEHWDYDAFRRAVGQLVIVGFTGTNTSSLGFRRLLNELERGDIGGVLFSSENIVDLSDLKAMISALRHCACAAVPLIAVDEEGGTVERVGSKFGLRHILPASEIARSGEDVAKNQYHWLARKLFELGFNMNLGPVVDLNKNPRNPIIGAVGRSFSRDPIVVENFAKIFIAEHHELGILTVLKHFPGHGSSSIDSHQAAPDVQQSWSADELLPYERLIRTGLVDCIMVGHLANERIWGGVATQKGSRAIAEILRQQLKFDNPVISDDLTMNALRPSRIELPNYIRSAVSAGVDLILLGQSDSVANEDLGLLANSAIMVGLASRELTLNGIALSGQRVAALKRQLNFPQTR
jgi:beta-N-acetylhexosaminidase